MIATDSTALVDHLVARSEDVLSTDWAAHLLPGTIAEIATADIRSGADYAYFAVATAHRSGDEKATAVLLGNWIRAVRSIARQVHHSDPAERMQVAILAYLRGVEELHDRTNCASRVYYSALKFVTRRQVSVNATAVGDSTAFFEDSTASQSTSLDAYLSAEAIIEFGLEHGLSDSDARTLRVVHCRPEKVAVRILAAELGVREDRLETQIRRARRRLRDVVSANSDAVERFVRSSAVQSERSAEKSYAADSHAIAA